MAYDDADREKM